MNLYSSSYLIVLFLLISPLRVQAAIVPQSTRIIYPGDKRETALMVSNTDKNDPFLVQSWVDNNGPDGTDESSASVPFIVAPPVFRLNVGEDNSIRIIRTAGSLPKDRESLFWLNIKAIPKIPDNAPANSQQITVKSRLKLFYRPQALGGAKARKAYQQLLFSRAGDQLRITNPTPYYFTFFQLSVGSANVETGNTLIAPLGKTDIPLPNGTQTGEVSWRVINDYGGASAQQKAQLR
jgi:P pilus assembly chaperone PapD